jgi:hypothetical protein
VTLAPAPSRTVRRPAAAPSSRRVPGSIPVFLVGTAVAGAVSVWSATSGWNFAYTDAMAHLTIARRVLDSPSAGPAQLGTVWLPFPHLLLLPLVQSLWLWKTGVAACIVSSLCFGSACASTYRVLARLGVDMTGRLVALLVLMANPSLLYVSTTALTEPVLIACLMACIAGLIGWATSPRQLSGGELCVFAGLPAAGAAMSRYEGWALTLTGSVFVLVVCLQRHLPWRRTLTYIASFCAPVVLAVIAWVVYNYAMYGNPLDFMNGTYSAAQFNKGFRFQGVLQTEGNLGLSFSSLFHSLFEIAGLVPLLIAGAGLVVMMLTWSLLDRRALAVWLAATSTAFLLYSLWAGQHIVMNDASVPKGDFNNRQTLSAMPWVAILCGLALGLPWARGKVRAALAGVAVIGIAGQNVWWAQDYYHRSSVLAEAQNGLRVEVNRTEVSRWIGAHYDGGHILLDETSIASLPQMGIPLREFVLRSNGADFPAALEDPASYARWVVMHRTQAAYDGDTHDNDQVTDAMRRLPQFGAAYALVHENPDYVVYRLDES